MRTASCLCATRRLQPAVCGSADLSPSLLASASRRTHLFTAQKVTSPRYEHKWRRFIAFTAISLKHIRRVHRKRSCITDQISFTGGENRCESCWVVRLLSERGLVGRQGTSINRRAINCEEKRSDRWADGFDILLPRLVHLHLMKWDTREEVEGNDLCQCITPNCSFTWTYKWGSMVWAMSAIRNRTSRGELSCFLSLPECPTPGTDAQTQSDPLV